MLRLEKYGSQNFNIEILDHFLNSDVFVYEIADKNTLYKIASTFDIKNKKSTMKNIIHSLIKYYYSFSSSIQILFEKLPI